MTTVHADGHWIPDGRLIPDGGLIQNARLVATGKWPFRCGGFVWSLPIAVGCQMAIFVLRLFCSVTILKTTGSNAPLKGDKATNREHEQNCNSYKLNNCEANIQRGCL